VLRFMGSQRVRHDSATELIMLYTYIFHYPLDITIWGPNRYLDLICPNLTLILSISFAHPICLPYVSPIHLSIHPPCIFFHISISYILPSVHPI